MAKRLCDISSYTLQGNKKVVYDYLSNRCSSFVDVYIEEKIYILSPGTSTEKYIKHYLNFNKRENEPSLLKKRQ